MVHSGGNITSFHQERAKSSPVLFLKWYNSIPVLCGKKIPVPYVRTFSPGISSQIVKAHCSHTIRPPLVGPGSSGSTMGRSVQAVSSAWGVSPVTKQANLRETVSVAEVATVCGFRSDGGILSRGSLRIYVDRKMKYITCQISRPSLPFWKFYIYNASQPQCAHRLRRCFLRRKKSSEPVSIRSRFLLYITLRWYLKLEMFMKVQVKEKKTIRKPVGFEPTTDVSVYHANL